MVDDENMDLTSRVIAFYTKHPNASFILLVDKFPMADPAELRMIIEEIKSGKIQTNNSEIKKMIKRMNKNKPSKVLSFFKKIRNNKILMALLPWIMLICGLGILVLLINVPYFNISRPLGFYEWFIIVATIVGGGLAFIGLVWILTLIKRKTGIEIRIPSLK